MVAIKQIQRRKTLNLLKLKRLFRIGCGLFLNSIIPILGWVVLSYIMNDTRVSNVFSLTYSLQFIWAILVAFFGTAANIRKDKEQDENQVYNGIFWGIIFSALSFLFPLIFVDKYIEFFGQDVAFYREYVIYTVVLLFVQTLFSIIIEKLYFEDKDKKANNHLLAFNLVNFAALIISALIFDRVIIALVFALASSAIYVVVLYVLHFKKFKIKFDFWKNFKYESNNIVSYLFMFIIYLVGLKNAYSAGDDYILALTVVGLCTDACWDALKAISTVVKVDIAKNRYDYKQEYKNAILYMIAVVCISIVSAISLGLLNSCNITYILVYLSFQVFDMVTEPFKAIISTYTQLEYSPTINTACTLIFRFVRALLAVFIISPYCTEIGQTAQAVLLLVTCLCLRYTKYKVIDGKLLIKKDGSA